MSYTIKQPTEQFLFFLKQAGVIYRYNGELFCFIPSPLFLLFRLAEFSQKQPQCFSCFFFFFSDSVELWDFTFKSRFIFGFSFPCFPPSCIFTFTWLFLSPIFSHTHPSLLLCPLPALLIHPHLALTLQTLLQKLFLGTSLAVHWLRLHASTAGGMGSIPGWGTKIPHATRKTWPKKKILKNLPCDFALTLY